MPQTRAAKRSVSVAAQPIESGVQAQGPLTFRLPPRENKIHQAIREQTVGVISTTDSPFGCPPSISRPRRTKQATLGPSLLLRTLSPELGVPMEQIEIATSPLTEYNTYDSEGPNDEVEEDGLTLTSSSIQFNNADKESVAQIQALVEDLNYSIDNLITSILEKLTNLGTTVEDRKSSVRRGSIAYDDVPATGFKPGDIGPMKAYYEHLDNPKCTDVSLRAKILDLILHDLVCRRIYDAFFQGKTFLGINEETSGTLECLYSAVASQQGPSMAQHWRSMSISAAFQTEATNTVRNIASRIFQEISQITRRFPVIAPYSSTLIPRSTDGRRTVSSAFKRYETDIEKIVQKSRDLSLNIQRNMIISSLELAIIKTPGLRGVIPKFIRTHMASVWDVDVRSTCKDQVLGTFKFGLNLVELQEENKNQKPKKTPIITVTVITAAFSKMLKKKFKAENREEIQEVEEDN